MELSDEDSRSIVKTLTSQPSQEELTKALSLFEPSSTYATSYFASIIFAIVNTTIPELWQSLHTNITDNSKTINLIVGCLSSVSGVNALLMRLDQLYLQIRHQSSQNEKHQLEDILEILTLILENDKFSPKAVINSLLSGNMKTKMLFNEYVLLAGGSRILNMVSKITTELDLKKDLWIGDGKKYSKWLGQEVGKATKLYPDNTEVSTLFGKALNIGYPCIAASLLQC